MSLLESMQTRTENVEKEQAKNIYDQCLGAITDAANEGNWELIIGFRNVIIDNNKKLWSKQKVQNDYQTVYFDSYVKISRLEAVVKKLSDDYCESYYHQQQNTKIILMAISWRHTTETTETTLQT